MSTKPPASRKGTATKDPAIKNFHDNGLLSWRVPPPGQHLVNDSFKDSISQQIISHDMQAAKERAEKLLATCGNVYFITEEDVEKRKREQQARDDAHDAAITELVYNHDVEIRRMRLKSEQRMEDELDGFSKRLLVGLVSMLVAGALLGYAACLNDHRYKW